MSTAHHAIAPVRPELIGAVLDRIAHVPADIDLDSVMLIAIVCAAGARDAERPSLVARILAVTQEFNDPRWSPWAAYLRRCPYDDYAAFDATFLEIVAELPINSSGRFSPDLFFRALLVRTAPLNPDDAQYSQLAARASP